MDNPEEDLNGLQLWSLNELVGLTAFQSSFLLFATFGVKLWRDICLIGSFDLVFYK